MSERRQYRVTALATGETWLVMQESYGGHSAYSWSQGVGRAAQQVGLRFPSECEVRVVPRGMETPLPFDELPLRIRGPREARAA